MTYCPHRCPAHYYANSFLWLGSVLLPSLPPSVSVSVPLTDFSFWPRFGLVVRGVWIIGEKGEEWGAWLSQLLPTRGSSTNAIQTGKNTSWAEGNSRWPGTDRTQQKEQCTLCYLDGYNTHLLIKRLNDSLNGDIYCMFSMFSVWVIFHCKLLIAPMNSFVFCWINMDWAVVCESLHRMRAHQIANTKKKLELIFLRHWITFKMF